MLNYTFNAKLIKPGDAKKIVSSTYDWVENFLPTSVLNRITINFDDSRDSYCTPTSGTGPIGLNVGVGLARGYADEFGLPHNVFLSMVEGLLIHEFGHVLFTDFGQRVRSTVQLNKFKQAMVDAVGDFCEETDVAKKDALKSIVEECWKTYQFHSSLMSINNMLEDGYIERMLKQANVENDKHLSPLRYALAVSTMKNLDDNFAPWRSGDLEGKISTFSNMQSEILIAATAASSGFRFTNLLEEGFNEELTNYYDKKELQEVVLYSFFIRNNAKNSEEVWASSVLIGETIKKYWFECVKDKFEEAFQEMLENYENLKDFLNQEEQELMQNSGMGGMPQDGDSFIPPSISVDSSSTPSASNGQTYIPKNLQDKIMNKVKEEMEQSDKSEQSKNSNQDGQDGQDGNNSEKNQNSQNENSSDNQSGDASDSQSGDSGDSSSEEMQQAIDEALAQSATETDVANDSAKSQLNKEEALRQKQMAEQHKKDMKKKAAEDLKEASSGDFKKPSGGNGKAPRSTPNNFFDGTLNAGQETKFIDLSKDTSNRVSGDGRRVELLKMAHNIAKPMQKILQEQARNKIQTNIFNGPDINVSALPNRKRNPKVFEKVSYGDKSKATIGIIVDCSGSMHGDKIRDAKEAAYMFGSVLQKIKSKFQIWGHQDLSNVTISEAVKIQDCSDKSQLENIWKLQAGGGNWDSIPIYKMLLELKAQQKTKNENLYLWVISDGAPAGGWNYHGEAAEKDIRSIIEFFEKQYNIKTIGIGIGQDVESVPRIYKNNIIVSDVSKLGTEMVKLLTKLVVK